MARTLRLAECKREAKSKRFTAEAARGLEIEDIATH